MGSPNAGMGHNIVTDSRSPDISVSLPGRAAHEGTCAAPLWGIFPGGGQGRPRAKGGKVALCVFYRPITCSGENEERMFPVF